LFFLVQVAGQIKERLADAFQRFAEIGQVGEYAGVQGLPAS
jgi:hypothetical protein